MTELTQADRDTLRRMIEHDWVDAALAADWDATLAMCSDDIAYLAPDGPPLHGREQAREFFEGFPRITAFAQTLNKIWGDTSVAAALGEFTLTMDGDDGPISGKGKFLVTASKSSGNWLWTATCFNWNAPPS